MASRISVFFNGMPEFENLFGIAERLKARGNLEPVCFVPVEVLWREPRLRQLISKSRLSFTIRPNRFFKAFPSSYLKRADCNLTLSDPLIDQGAHIKRSQAILDNGHPTILVQHGVIQRHIAVRIDRDDVDYHSCRILTFEEPLATNVLSRETLDKVRVVGFIKPQLLPPKPPGLPLPAHERAILFCHSFRWEGRYSERDVERFFTLVKAYATRHPDDLLIVRSHRGKIRSNYKRETLDLSGYPNIVISHAYEGPLKGLGMTDVLAISDVCISSASTAILDSVYMDCPTATYENDQKVFQTLPDITDLETLEQFLQDPSVSASERVKAHYGDVAKNMDRACTEIELCMDRL